MKTQKNELFQILVDLEKQLMDPESRKDISFLEKTLDTTFLEIGSSGKIWSRESILRSLPQEQTASFMSYDFSVRSLAQDLELVNYRTENLDGGVVTSESLRSSIWKRVDGQWKIIFHQGTRVVR